MSQSATLYSISPSEFKRLHDAPGVEEFESSQAKNQCVFSSTFMGLEFVLAKNRDEEEVQLLSEIFTPSQTIGEEVDDDTDHEQFDLIEEGSAVPYLDPATINEINGILQEISASDIEDAYDADEMNDNGVYPGEWADEDSMDANGGDSDEDYGDTDDIGVGMDDESEGGNQPVLGKSLLVIEFKKLRSFISEAARRQNYILVVVG